MKLNTYQQDEATVIEIKGKFLGSLRGGDYKAAIDALEEGAHVVVDLGETEFMDSTAIGALIASLTTVRRSGGDVRLANLKKRIRGVFLMTHLLGPVFADYASVEAAVESYRAQPNPAPAAEA
ncbi:MAG TPA: STAS domain-containing protein [Chloroflexota bacterium]|nr:STAS domain-containing protein [Chloroflexota bacterium]